MPQRQSAFPSRHIRGRRCSRPVLRDIGHDCVHSAMLCFQLSATQTAVEFSDPHKDENGARLALDTVATVL